MLKKLYCLTLLFLCLLFSSTAWGQDLVGAEDNSSGFFAATSTHVAIPDNSVTTITFVNYGSEVNNWNNWNLCLAKSDADITGDSNVNTPIHALLRSDLYGWTGNRNGGTALSGITNTGYSDWDSFKDNMNGANVVITINRTGGNVSINAVATKESTTYTESTTVPIAEGELVYAYLVTDNSHFTNVVATQQRGLTGTIVGNQDFTSGWFGDTSEKWLLADKTTTTITFVNHNDQTTETYGYKNWVLAIAPDKVAKTSGTDPMYGIIRADHFGWKNTRDVSSGTPTLSFDSNWAGDWVNFNNNLKNANVTITITRDGASLDVKAVMTATNGSGVEYVSSTTVPITDNAAYAYLTVENAFLSNVQMTRNASGTSVEGVIPADAGVSGSNPGTNTTVSWTNIGDPVSASDGNKYWKLNSNDVYVQLTGPFKAGDILTVGVSSNGDNKTVGFKLHSNTAEAQTVKANASEATQIVYTLTAADIESDGSIKLFRNGSEVRFYSFNVEIAHAGTYAVLAQKETYKNSALDNTLDGGTVTVTPSLAESGETVTFTATPASHYNFSGWYNGNSKVSDDLVYQTTVGAEDLVLTAHFTWRNDFSIRTAVSPAGKGEASVELNTNEDNYISLTPDMLLGGGQKLKFTATSTSDLVFSHWSYGNEQTSKNNPFVLDGLYQSALGWTEGSYDYEPIFTANFVTQTKEWDFTNGWTNEKLTDGVSLGTMTLNNDVSQSSGWNIEGGGLRARAGLLSLSFPVIKGQAVTVYYKSYDSSYKAEASVSGVATSSLSVKSTEGTSSTLYATADGLITIQSKSGYSNFYIQKILISTPALKYKPANTSTTYAFNTTDRTEGQTLAEIYPDGKISVTGNMTIRRASNSSIYLLNRDSGTRQLTIKNVKKGENITLNLWADGTYGNFTLNRGNVLINGVSAVAGTAITNGTVMEVAADGDVVLNITRNGHVDAINITSARYMRNINTYFIDPSSAEFLENTTGQTPTITSDNPYVAFYRDGKYFYLHPGTVTFTAKATPVGGSELTTSMTLDVYSDDAEYEIVGNTFTFTKPGLMSEPVITGVPKMKMQFGHADETIIVEDDFYAKIIDFQGYNHCGFNEGLPRWGSYYVFTPEASGKLTLDIDYDARLYDETKQDYGTGKAFDLVKGHTYYVANSGGVLRLKSFTFEYTLKVTEKAPILAANTPTYTQLVTNADHYKLEFRGDITADEYVNPSTGTITGISGAGGAIIVTVYDGADESTASSDFYVLTVPYANHTWDFTRWQDDSNWKQIDYDGKQWGVEYEVREYKDFDIGLEKPARYLTYLNEPILSPTTLVTGESAAYFGETAGLMFSGAGRTFGERASGDDEIAKYQAENPGVEITDAKRDELLRIMRNYTLDNINKTSINMPALKSGATLTIPGLKAGSYVAIKFWRHAPNSGDNIKITNVYDLRGTQGDEADKAVSESDRVQVVNQTGSAQVATAKYGWLEFKVKEDGNVTIQVTDQGWTHIKKIAISDQGFINTDMRLVIGTHTATTRYAFPGTPDGNFKDIVQYSTDRNYVHTENGKGIVFSIKPGSVKSPGGETAITVTPGGLLQASSFGTATIVQKVFNNGTDYLVDFEETDIVITPPVGDTHQTYPYTWDFTNISQTTKDALTEAGDWDGNASDGFTPGSSAQNGYLQNSDLKFDIENESGGKIPEFDGLGFATTVNAQGQTAHLDNMTLKPAADINNVQPNEGLRIGTTDETIVIVPDVPEGAKAYVRLVPGTTDKKVILTGNDQYQATPDEGSVTTPFQTVNGEELYVVDGHGGDVVITFKDVTVKGIGVTNIFKACRFWDEVNDLIDDHRQFCYHSDSHDVDIDYTLTKFYTDVEMTAFKTGSYNADEQFLDFVPVTVVPANEGLIVRTIDYMVEHPLFVPAVNTTYRSDMSGNQMVGFPNGGTAAEVKQRLDYANSSCYGFTNLFGKVVDNQLQEDRVTANMPGFYALYISDSSKLNSNLAILKFAQQSAKARMITFVLRDKEDESATPVESVISAIEDGYYYTLTGVKLNSMPTNRGVYILNGKKVFVK